MPLVTREKADPCHAFVEFLTVIVVGRRHLHHLLLPHLKFWSDGDPLSLFHRHQAAVSVFFVVDFDGAALPLSLKMTRRERTLTLMMTIALTIRPKAFYSNDESSLLDSHPEWPAESDIVSSPRYY
jgi:hypothetical protein